MKLKTYPKYKDSGIEWIGEIPEGWDIQKIKIFSELYGRIGFRGYTVDDLVEEGKGAITLGPPNIEDQKLIFNKKTYISWEKFDESPEIKVFNGDILLVKTASVGKVAFVENLNESATVNPQLVVFKKIKIFAKFFYYCLIAPLIQNQILSDMNGGVVSTLSQENIKNYFCIIPSLQNQVQIISFLDKKTSEIDKTIEKDTKLIELLKEKRNALINHVVTKGLDYDAKMKDSGIEWIGEIPDHWLVKKLSYEFDTRDGTHGTPEVIPENSESYPLITSKDISKNHINFDNAKHISEKDYIEISRRSLVEKSDIIMPMIGTIGNPVIVNSDKKFAIKNVALFKNNNKNDIKWLFYCLNSDIFNIFVGFLKAGGVQKFIALGNLRSWKVPIPEIAEQKQLVEYLDKRTSKIDIIIEKIENKIKLMEEYKKSLIHHVVTGKVDVRGDDSLKQIHQKKDSKQTSLTI